MLWTEASCHQSQTRDPTLCTSIWAEARHCLCWAWSHLVGAMFKPRLATAYASFDATWWELQCKSRLAFTCVGLGAAWQELQCMLMLVAAWVGFVDLGRECNDSWGRPLMWRSLGRGLDRVSYLGVIVSQEDTRVGWTMLVRLMESDRFCAFLCWPGWVEGDPLQRTVEPVSTFIPWKSSPDPCTSSPCTKASQFSFSL